jgi:hypothetical protein
VRWLILSQVALILLSFSLKAVAHFEPDRGRLNGYSADSEQLHQQQRGGNTGANSMRFAFIIGSIVIAIVVASNDSSFAEYVADGQIEGNVCTNYFFFQTCHNVNIDAVKGTDGEFHTVKDKFDSVDEYHEGSSLCFVRVKHDDWYSSLKSWIGWIGWIAGYNLQQTFLTDKGGKFERVDPEYLVFHCKKLE